VLERARNRRESDTLPCLGRRPDRGGRTTAAACTRRGLHRDYAVCGSARLPRVTRRLLRVGV